MSEYVHVCTHIFVYNFGKEEHRLSKVQVHGPKVKPPFPQVKLDFIWLCYTDFNFTLESRTWMTAELEDKRVSKRLILTNGGSSGEKSKWTT